MHLGGLHKHVSDVLIGIFHVMYFLAEVLADRSDVKVVNIHQGIRGTFISPSRTEPELLFLLLCEDVWILPGENIKPALTRRKTRDSDVR